MRWEKLGLVFRVNKHINNWIKSHAYVPTPLEFDDYIRVYVSFWDNNSIGRIGYVDLDINNITKVLHVSKNPCFNLPEKGFSSLGATPMSFYNNYLLYSGWTKVSEVPYSILTGMAHSLDFTTFKPLSCINPILPSTCYQKYIRSAASIVDDKLWYIGGSDWVYTNKKVPTYSLYYIDLEKTSLPILSLSPNTDKGEYGIGRPWIIKNNNYYKLYYSSRSIYTGYSLKQAESLDGVKWENIRSVESITHNRLKGEEEMQCFSSIIKTKTGTYMFYNGNEHGKDGFFVARCIQ